MVQSPHARLLAAAGGYFFGLEGPKVTLTAVYHIKGGEREGRRRRRSVCVFVRRLRRGVFPDSGHERERDGRGTGAVKSLPNGSVLAGRRTSILNQFLY